MKLVPYLTPLTKINLKWIKVLNRRGNSIKLLEENVEKKLLDFGFRKDFFFGYNTQGTNIKSKSQQIVDFKCQIVKFKCFCTAKETINKRHPMRIPGKYLLLFH